MKVLLWKEIGEKMASGRGVSGIRQGVFCTARLPFLEVRTTYASVQPYAPHFHDSLSLGVVFRGRTLLRCGDEEVLLGSGDMVLIAPLEVHSCNPVDDEGRGYHMFAIDAPWALACLGATTDQRLSIVKRVISDVVLFEKLMLLAQTMANSTTDTSDPAALRTLLSRHCRTIPVADTSNSVVSLSRERLLADGADSPLAIAGLADDFGMARETFIRLFHRGTGVTPGSYRQCLRLARARRLLRQGADIAQTAYACGYADQSHFHRMCVRYLAATPRQIKPSTSLSFKK